ncbi:MAG: creatininase family protein [Tannerellaceae bacterium]|jgi:creatinine amidohydrolase|nr:creatininase family protein [Tannerellaceae bacterium]
MKRRDFITKGIGVGVIAGTGHSLLANPAYYYPGSFNQPNTDNTGSSNAVNPALPTFWEDLTSPDFKDAVAKAGGVCIVPIGVYEKHGPHLPLGTDVIRAKEMCRRAAEQEYCIVHPDFYAGQIFEAKQQPGTIAYSAELMLRLLDETCREIARNGLKKIILVNTHGGNNSFLPYFLQIQLESPRDYTVFLFRLHEEQETQKKITALRKSTTGGHADEIETAEMLVVRPESVRMDQVNIQSGKNLNRMQLTNVTTGISWYAQYPNHYAGDSAGATTALGEVRLASRSKQLADAVKALKADDTARKLQDEFFKQSLSPLTTGTWK